MLNIIVRNIRNSSLNLIVALLDAFFELWIYITYVYFSYSFFLIISIIINIVINQKQILIFIFNYIEKKIKKINYIIFRYLILGIINLLLPYLIYINNMFLGLGFTCDNFNLIIGFFTIIGWVSYLRSIESFKDTEPVMPGEYDDYERVFTISKNSDGDYFYTCENEEIPPTGPMLWDFDDEWEMYKAEWYVEGIPDVKDDIKNEYAEKAYEAVMIKLESDCYEMLWLTPEIKAKLEEETRIFKESIKDEYEGRLEPDLKKFRAGMDSSIIAPPIHNHNIPSMEMEKLWGVQEGQWWIDRKPAEIENKRVPNDIEGQNHLKAAMVYWSTAWVVFIIKILSSK